jgi:DNA polymerase I-like protein with 3'-5' exonuclease and polymerase domains
MGLKGATEGLDIRIVDTKEKLEAMLLYLDQSEVLAFDTETNDLDTLREEVYSDEDPWENVEEAKDIISNQVEFTEAFKLVGMSFAIDDIVSFYVPVGHTRPTQIRINEQPLVQLQKDYVLSKLMYLFDTKKIIAHNLKYDYISASQHHYRHYHQNILQNLIRYPLFEVE